MKLVSYEKFCRMPAGTIFAPYQPCVLDERLSIKVDGGDENGWFNGVMPLEPWNVEEIREKGECPVSFETYDGANADYMDYDQILVFDEADVDRMINILKWAKKGCVGEPEGCPENCTDEKKVGENCPICNYDISMCQCLFGGWIRSEIIGNIHDNPELVEVK